MLVKPKEVNLEGETTDEAFKKRKEYGQIGAIASNLEKDGVEKLPAEMTDEELVERHEVLKFQLEELDAEAKIIREEFGDRLANEHLDAKIVGDFNVGKTTMVRFSDTPLEVAKEYGATKEVIDEPMLRKLYKAGTPIEGAKEITYVKITQSKAKDEETNE